MFKYYVDLRVSLFIDLGEKMHSKTSYRNFVGNLLILWVGHLLCDLMIGFWTIYKTMAGLDIAKAGLIAGVGATMGESMQMIFGPMSDQGRRKRLLGVSLLLLGGTAFLPFAETYTMWFLLFGLTSVGSGMFHPSAGGLTGVIAGDRKGLLAGLFFSGGALGMAVSHILFAHTYCDGAGNTAVFAIPLILLLLFILFVRVPETPVEKRAKNPKFSDIFKLFRRQDMRNLYFCVVCNQALFWGTVFILPDLLKSHNYETWLWQGGGHMAFLIGGAAMMVPSGYLADRYSARSVILTCTAMAIFFYSFFLFQPFHTPMMVMTLLFIMGGCVGNVASLGLGLGTHLMPHNPGMASAFLMGMVWAVAEFVGPVSSGVLAGYFEVNAFAKALTVLSVLNLVVFGLALRLPVPVEEAQPA